MSEKKENLTQNKEPGKIKRSFTSRQFKSGAYSSVITVIVIALVVVVNMVFNKLDLSTDLTSDSLFTLTKESQKTLKNVKDDITIYGIYKGKRAKRYISSRYVDLADSHIGTYKVVIPKADGNGGFGDTLTKPEVLGRQAGFTHTFLGIGTFASEMEAVAALKYIKSKFARCLLSVLKITQDMNADKWRYVPLQDFTDNSDINWNTSIANIDKQLYKKYGLSQEEIDFIETHVKEMA